MHPWTDFHTGLSLLIGVIGFAVLGLIAFDLWIESGNVKGKLEDLTQIICDLRTERHKLQTRISKLEGK